MTENATAPVSASSGWLARWQLRAVKAALLYCLVSILTLPFLNALWLGEVPLLALPQLPKMAVAAWLRQEIVMPVLKQFGFSKGSFSPDYLQARPFGLGLAYSIPLISFSLSLLLPGCGTTRHRRWLLLLVALLLVDAAFTHWFAGNRHVSLY